MDADVCGVRIERRPIEDEAHDANEEGRHVARRGDLDRLLADDQPDDDEDDA